MNSISADIVIQAPVETVWKILTDFEKYPSWNPFIKSIKGIPTPGKRFKVVLQQPGSSPMTFRPTCLKLEPNREFRWRGHFLFKGIFDGEHIFELKKIGENKTKFIQREIFKGILVPLLWRQLNTKTRQGFEQMNSALKTQAEF